MATRRMINLSIIDSDTFLEMAVSSQSLYFHSIARADDDGILDSPKKVMRICGANDDDLKLLIVKGFVIPFNADKIIVITHWHLHNTIRPDRKIPTVHQDILQQLCENKGVYTPLAQYDSQMPVVSQPNVNQVSTECRHSRVECNIIESNVLEDSGESTPSSAPPPKKSSQKSERHKYGEYNHVLLTDEQLKKLNEDFGNNTVVMYIKKIDEYCQQTGKTYKDYNLTIRNWIGKDGVSSGFNGGRNANTADTEHSKYAIEF